MKKKALVVSLLTVALCISIICGATFAIFTDQESVNIAVNTGKVEVVANIVDLELSSMGKVISGNTFENGGTAEYDAKKNELILNKITPGDSVSFDINIVNNSDIKAKYALQFIVNGALSEVLEITNGSSIADGSWNNIEMDEKLSVPVTITLPYSVSNTYQDSSATVTVLVKAIQANIDTEVIYVSSATDLVNVANEINSGVSYTGKTVILTEDIDLAGIDWTPINMMGKECNQLVIDGYGHSIKNMSVLELTQGYGSGFIGDMGGNAVTIKNLTFTGAKVSANAYNVVGIITGYAYGTTVFDNVTVEDSTVIAYGKVGVFVGMGADPGVKIMFNNCKSIGNTINAAYNAGGLAGLIQRDITTNADNTIVTNTEVRDNKFELMSTSNFKGETTVLSNVKITCDGSVSSCITKGFGNTISGIYREDNSYYWGCYATYYISYGNSAHDCSIEGGVKKIANSEICIDKIK